MCPTTPADQRILDYYYTLYYSAKYVTHTKRNTESNVRHGRRRRFELWAPHTGNASNCETTLYLVSRLYYVAHLCASYRRAIHRLFLGAYLLLIWTSDSSTSQWFFVYTVDVVMAWKCIVCAMSAVIRMDNGNQ